MLEMGSAATTSFASAMICSRFLLAGRPRVFGVFRNGSLDSPSRERDGSQPSLADLVREASASSNTIQKATLVVDAGLIARPRKTTRRADPARDRELDRAVSVWPSNNAGDKALSSSSPASSPSAGCA